MGTYRLIADLCYLVMFILLHTSRVVKEQQQSSEVQIPCEFCQTLYDPQHLHAHQVTMIHRITYRLKTAVNYPITTYSKRTFLSYSYLSACKSSLKFSGNWQLLLSEYFSAQGFKSAPN